MLSLENTRLSVATDNRLEQKSRGTAERSRKKPPKVQKSQATKGWTTLDLNLNGKANAILRHEE
jgi:hypothetical protein